MNNSLVVSQKQQPLIEVEEPEEVFSFDMVAMQQRRERERQALRALLDAIYAPDYGETEKERWQQMWDEQREMWLERFRSEHTRDAYGRSLREFRSFLYERFAIRYLWFVEPDHAASWIKFMSTTGSTQRPGAPLSDRTINLRVAAVSSFYTHMTMAVRLVNGNQVGLFVSADGHHRLNPFLVDSVERPVVEPFGSSKPVPTRAMQWILHSLSEKREKTLANYRDYALLYLFYRTGYRASSALEMRWGDLEPAASDDGVVHNWTGKGNKAKKKKMPPRVWNAILAYLRADGRYVDGVGLDPDEFIWQPVSSRGVRNLTIQRAMANRGVGRNEAELMADKDLAVENRHIVLSTANEMLRRHLIRFFTFELRQEGVPIKAAKTEATKMAGEYHLHSLRHLYAHQLDRASKGDLRLVSEALDHGQLETTRIYLEKIRDPESRAADLLQAEYGF